MKSIKLATKSVAFAFALISTTQAIAQEQKANILDTVYGFEMKVDLPATSVKDQYKSGTCWSFSAISFIESELLRTGKGEYDLSEMFIVNRDYHVRAIDYIRWNGAKKFSSGSECGNVFNRIKEYGIVPQSVYAGLNYGTDKHQNRELDASLKNYIQAINANSVLTTAWLNGFDGILDAYLGEIPESFEYNGKKYTPAEFRNSLGLNFDDYVELTSFTHHPYYSSFILEIEDNWELDAGYNITIDDLAAIAFNSLDKGYTVAWGGDVSENGFSWNKGLAVVPEEVFEDNDDTDMDNFNQGSNSNKPTLFEDMVPEMGITPELRQKAFDNRETTDDHGMHITGYLTDKNGTRYFKVKNSWNTNNPYNGYLYMSENYYKYKTISIFVHKNAIPDDIKKKLGISK